MVKDVQRIGEILRDVYASPKTVALLINTRNRFKELQETIDSALLNASKPDNVEIIIRVDDDDTETINQLPKLPAQVKAIIGKRNGYEFAHVGYMEMALQSCAEFLMIYADDFYLCPAWDTFVERHRGQLCVIFGHKELATALHRSIPLVWEKFALTNFIEAYYKIIALELGVYVRYDGFVLTHAHRGTIRDYVADTEAYQWPRTKGELYEFTDNLKPFVKPELFVGHKPVIGKCNTWAHPINDYKRGKIYWYPIAYETDPGYWGIPDAGEWFHPECNWHYDPEMYKGKQPPQTEKQKPRPSPSGMPPCIG